MTRRQHKPGTIVSDQRRVAWQGWSCTFGTEISEDETAQLANRICGMFDFLTESTARRFERLVEAFTRHIVKPAMVGTANAFLLDVSVFEGCPAMGTVKSYKTHSSAAVSEEY